jgi:hypothetical protein
MTWLTTRAASFTEIDGPPLTPATARQLGAALIAAADEAEQMAGYDKIGTPTE